LNGRGQRRKTMTKSKFTYCKAPGCPGHYDGGTCNGGVVLPKLYYCNSRLCLGHYTPDNACFGSSLPDRSGGLPCYCSCSNCPGHAYPGDKCLVSGSGQVAELRFCQSLTCPGHESRHELPCPGSLVAGNKHEEFEPKTEKWYLCGKSGCPGHELPWHKCS